MAKAVAEIEVTATTSRLAAALSVAASKFKAFSSTIASGVGKAFGKINEKMKFGEAGKNALGHFGGEMLTRGFDTIKETANGVRDFERNLVRFGIAAGSNAGQLREMRDQIRGLSKDTGVNSDEILAAGAKYFDLTGDAAGTTKALGSFARIAQASGAAMDDIATASAAMQDSMHLDPKDLEGVFSGLISQGKAGAVSLKDIAGEFTALLPRFARFKGALGADGIIQLGAAFQVAKKGFGSASEAATGLENLMGSLGGNAPKFAMMGVKIFDVGRDGTKTFRNLKTIMDDVGKSKLARDPFLLTKVFGGNKEAEATFNQLNRLHGMYDDMIAAGKDTQTVNRDLATYLDSDAGRLEVSFNKLKETIAQAFTPERITGFVNAVEALADKIGPVIDGVGKIGEAFAGLYHAGQKIRGFMSGNANNNPFIGGGNSYLDQLASQHRIPELEQALGHKLAPGEAEHRFDAVARNKRSAAGYDSAVENIMDAQVNDRTTKESIRRAVVASLSPNTPEGIGAASAGSTYLQTAGISKEEAGAIYAKAFGEALKNSPLAVQIAAAIRDSMAPPEVHLGDNQVSKSAKKATAPRRGPHA